MMESYNYSRTARAFNLKQSKVNLQKTIYLPKVSTESDVTTGTLSTLAIYRDKDVFAEVEVAYLEVVKYVYLREDQLKFLEASIRKCSQLYWKLAEALIQEERDFHTPSTEASSAYRKSLIEAQILLRRDIIACREQTLCLLEAVTSWRSLNATQTRRAIVPTVLYKGENYLVKMLTDVNLLFESGIVRIWLGFQPDCFLLPPSSKDLDPSQYDPLTHWKETYKKKYHEWRRLKAVVNTRRERSEKVSPSKGKLLEAVHQIILPLKPHTMADVVLDALTEVLHKVFVSVTEG